MKNFGAGIIIGALLGGILGLALAPQKGSATREKMKQVTHNAGKKFAVKFDIRKVKPESDEYIRQSI